MFSPEWQQKIISTMIIRNSIARVWLNISSWSTTVTIVSVRLWLHWVHPFMITFLDFTLERRNSSTEARLNESQRGISTYSLTLIILTLKLQLIHNLKSVTMRLQHSSSLIWGFRNPYYFFHVSAITMQDIISYSLIKIFPRMENKFFIVTNEVEREDTLMEPTTCSLSSVQRGTSNPSKLTRVFALLSTIWIFWLKDISLVLRPASLMLKLSS